MSQPHTKHNQAVAHDSKVKSGKSTQQSQAQHKDNNYDKIWNWS